MKVDIEARPSIEEILNDPYFSDVSEEVPSLDPEEQKLRDFLDDLIKRLNVHVYEGKEAFEALFAEQIA